MAIAGSVGGGEFTDILSGIDVLIASGVADPDRLGIGGGSCGWEGPGPHVHDRVSPISFVSRVGTPVLIVHGEDDTNVPLGQAIYFHRALSRFGVEHEFVVYPREGARVRGAQSPA